ncbi:hypothetical protein [Achromobacter insolitus]|uniref:hypothetical protein n=1 Tax=Achromobacter insolitus TaxID=217204 RepID=UPI0020A344B6|nr:hypothetical protein [Achromobacter insolitus]MCP1404464.1 hypothetical protein [Achromobacter insolitus]
MIPAMNRQQRRMMEKQQARVRATRRPRPEHIPMLVKAQYTLEPLESLIDQIERLGTVYTAQGEAIFPNHGDGVWYPAVGAVAGMADFFEMWAIRHNKPLNVSALRQLAARLENGMPVDQPLVDRLRTLFPVLRRVGATLLPDDAEDLIRQTLIKNELGAARVQGA